MAFWTATGRDTLKNGTVLGALLGVAILYGEKIESAIISVLPEAVKTFAGEFSIPIVIIGSATLAGYIIDRR